VPCPGSGVAQLSTLGHIRAMKNMRAFLMSFLLVADIYVLSGCATTSHDSYTVIDNSSGLEKKQPSPTEDMTAAQKTGYYLGWLSLDYLYSWAGSSPSFSP
jgi:hypothetical protein